MMFSGRTGKAFGAANWLPNRHNFAIDVVPNVNCRHTHGFLPLDILKEFALRKN